MAAAAPPQRSSDCEMNGTSSSESGADAVCAWAREDRQNAASSIHVATRPSARSMSIAAGRLRGVTVKPLVDGHDNQDEHQQGDDNHRRGDDDFRLPARQGLLDLARLSGNGGEVLPLE